MGILDKFAYKLGYSKANSLTVVEDSPAFELAMVAGRQKSVGPLVDDARIYRSLRSILASQTELGEVTSPYSQSVWVYSCVNTIAQNLQRVPFVLKKDAGALEPDIIDSGPMYDLFLNPNPYMTCKTLIEATFIYFGLRGEAFWILEGRDNITQIPKEIWTFDPLRFEEVQSKETGLLLGWKYKGKTDYFFDADQIIQFKMFNPYNDLRGISPVEASSLSISQDYQASVFNRSFLKNGATVGGFISIPAETELTDEQFDRLIKQFEDRHVGASRAHKIAVVEGGGQFTEAKLTQKDMDFMEGKRMTRQEILSAYKVNEVVLGIYTSMRSYEGIKAAHKAFWEECLMPKIEYFQEVLWAKLFSKIGVRRGKGRVWGEFDLANVGPLQSNYQDKIKTAMNMFHMGYPINDINRRLQLGMREVAWGDQWWVPGGFLPVTSIGGGEGKGSEATEEDIGEEVAGKKIAVCSPLDVDFKAKVKKFIFEQRKAVIASTLGKKNNRLGEEKEYAKLKESIYTLYRDAATAGVFYTNQKEMEEFAPMPMVMSDILLYSESRSVYITNGFKRITEEIVRSASESNTSPEVVVDKVREAFNLLSSKASAMAKNEINSAFQYGRDLASKCIRDALSPALGGVAREIEYNKPF